MWIKKKGHGREEKKKEKNTRGKEGIVAVKRWKKVGLAKEMRKKKKFVREKKNGRGELKML